MSRSRERQKRGRKANEVLRQDGGIRPFERFQNIEDAPSIVAQGPQPGRRQVLEKRKAQELLGKLQRKLRNAEKNAAKDPSDKRPLQEIERLRRQITVAEDVIKR